MGKSSLIEKGNVVKTIRGVIQDADFGSASFERKFLDILYANFQRQCTVV